MLLSSFNMAMIIAVVLDVLDLSLVPIFGLPIIGDIVDLLGIALLYKYIGKYALLSAIEIIPLVDVVPSFVVAVIIYRMREGDEME